MHSSDEEQPGAMRSGDRRKLEPSAADPERLGQFSARNGGSNLWSRLSRLGGILPAAGHADADTGPVLRGGQHPSGGRGADGRLVRAVGSPNRDGRPHFDAAVPPGGYGWWYVDAISKDGKYGLTIIAFIGSVFSPYYKRSGRGEPLDHVCLNVALYGPKARWVMTERGGGAAVQTADQLAIGPSNLRWTGDALEIDIVERDTRLFNPVHRKVRGKVRVVPKAINTVAFGLDPEARHRWHCLAPRAHVEVVMDQPDVSWKGDGYLDSNFGEESLEEGFRVWHWSRAHSREGSVVNYEGVRRDGSRFASALRFDKNGTPEPAELPDIAPLPNTFWQVKRRTRADEGHARVLDTWEDSPFYARSSILAQLYGERVVGVQESLDLDRFKSPIVQFMLPFRMPRV